MLNKLKQKPLFRWFTNLFTKWRSQLVRGIVRGQEALGGREDGKGILDCVGVPELGRVVQGNLGKKPFGLLGSGVAFK